MVHHIINIKPGKKQHNIVTIKASRKQLTRLRKGHKVRVTGSASGTGFNLIVSPERYDVVSRAFDKGKGAEIQLSSDEIALNQQHSSSMEGKGIFGNKVDKMVEKTLGKSKKNALYKAADKLKGPLKKGIDALAEHAPELGATALSGLAVASGNPELVPAAAIAGHHLGKIVGTTGSTLAKDYLENPSKFQSNVGGPRNKIAPHTLAGQVAQNVALQHLNNELGTNMGKLAEANLSNALAHMERSRMNGAQIHKTIGSGLWAGAGPSGNGLYAGAGPSSGTGVHHVREVGSIGKHGSFIGAQSQLPPALISQPFSSNFQFQFTLPPAYQKFSKGGGLYA